MGRRLVIFADGTGNAFSTQESNIWRLYNALDRSDADQVARYIQGVGTSGLRPYALLDGATGIGVPSNVRELYRFLCWNWRPGDEILMFGFSRGAFTIRTLIGLIHHEGLVPAEIDGRRVSSDEMGRNTKAAWRSYREKSYPTRWWQPLIGLVRLLRDAMLGGLCMLRGQGCYDAVAAQTRAQGRDEVRIRYVGLFDTVEAYGVPFSELGKALDQYVWPISFRNQVLSRNVDQARHALALDEDRQTFHPVRCERSDEGCNDIQEVWFAGAHSDVGGGYPDGELSLVPLAWIAEGAAKAGLRFKDKAILAFEEQGSPFGPRHDPRRGGAMFYRYAPRPIETGPRWGGEPVVHGTVARRMLDGNDGYAPLTLPMTAREHCAAGALTPITAAHDRLLPNPRLLEFAHDVVWWRKALYLVQLALVLVLLLLPVTIPWLYDQLSSVAQSDGRAEQVDHGLSTKLGSVPRMLVLDYAAAWVQTVLDYPRTTAFVALVFWMVWRRDQVLRDAAHDCARAAWFSAPAMAAPAAGSRSLLLARRLRESWAVWRVSELVPQVVLPGLLFLAALGGLLVAGSRTMVTYFAASPGAPFCLPAGAGPAPAPLADGAKTTRDGFDAASLCWRSGVEVEKGASYTIWIDATKPFFDSTVISGVGGFRVDSLWSVHTLGLPIRRWWNAEWFQPIAGIAGKGGSEWPLLSLDRTEVPAVDRDRHGAPRPADAAAAVPGLTPRFDDKGRMDEDSAGKAAKALDQRLDQRLVARFTAQATGELYLYLNDAIYWLPPSGRAGVRTWFYENNRGQASVTIRKERLPRPDQP